MEHSKVQETPHKRQTPQRSRKNSNVEDSKNDEVMPGCFESTKEASLLTILGVFGQSWDVYSDIGLSVQFANGINGKKHPKYAAVMMIPVALAFIFNIRQWWRNENGLKKRLVSAPFLILQLYPPFAALRLVVYLITKNKKWFEAKKTYDLSVTSIEPFLESVPQCYILLVIMLRSIQWTFNNVELAKDEYNENVIEPGPFFFATFVTSIVSAAFGMTKMLKVGPCSMVSRNKYGLGFMLIFLSIMLCIIGKGCMWGYMISFIGFDVVGILLCLGTCYLLPMAFQFSVFVRHQGWKKALVTCIDYPALLLMPSYAMWSFGASEKTSLFNRQQNSEVGVSFTVTFINSLITIGGLAITKYYMLQHYEFVKLVKGAIELNAKEDEESIPPQAFYWFIVWFVSFWTFLSMIISIALIAITACLSDLSCCGCSWCCNCCFPMTERDSIFKKEKEGTTIGTTETHELQTLVAVNQGAE